MGKQILRIPLAIPLAPKPFRDDGDGWNMCLICGCTDTHAWENAENNLCTACADRVRAIITPPYRDRLAVETLIFRETDPDILAMAHYWGKGDWRRSLIARQRHELTLRAIAGKA